MNKRTSKQFTKVFDAAHFHVKQSQPIVPSQDIMASVQSQILQQMNSMPQLDPFGAEVQQPAIAAPPPFDISKLKLPAASLPEKKKKSKSKKKSKEPKNPHRNPTKIWSDEETAILIQAMRLHGKNYCAIQQYLQQHSPVQRDNGGIRTKIQVMWRAAQRDPEAAKAYIDVIEQYKPGQKLTVVE